MAAAAADQVAVDLVGHHPEVILPHDLTGSAQLLLRPHAAGGILGIAPEYQFAGGIGALLLKVLEVHLKGAVGLFMERGGQHAHTGVLRRVDKVAVGRGVHQHLFVPGTQRLCQLVQGGNDARRHAQLLFREAPIVVVSAPFGESIVIFVVIQAGIAEDAAVDTAAESVQNLRGHAELHVGHPHADELLVLVGEHLLRAGMEDIAPEAVGIQCIGVAAVDDLVKVVGHCGCSFLFQ